MESDQPEAKRVRYEDEDELDTKFSAVAEMLRMLASRSELPLTGLELMICLEIFYRYPMRRTSPGPSLLMDLCLEEMPDDAIAYLIYAGLRDSRS